MSPERLSGLKIYSLGIVVQDKAVGSDQIVVYPVEELPTVSGDISKQQNNIGSLPNSSGAVKTVQAQSQNTLIATWIPFGHSNRMTSPDVVKNETVVIFRFMDTDEYYWTTIFREPSLRRTETVIYAFGNIPTGMTAFDSSTSYWFKVDTKGQKVQLHTADNNGEACGYDAIIDTANGVLTIEDTLGNSAILNSPQGLLTVNINKKVVVNTIDVVVNASNSTTVNTQTATVNANQSSTVNTQTATVNAQTQINLTTPLTDISGNVSIGGSLNVSGQTTSPTFNGNLNGNAKTATHAQTASSVG